MMLVRKFHNKSLFTDITCSGKNATISSQPEMCPRCPAKLQEGSRDGHVLGYLDLAVGRLGAKGAVKVLTTYEG